MEQKSTASSCLMPMNRFNDRMRDSPSGHHSWGKNPLLDVAAARIYLFDMHI